MNLISPNILADRLTVSPSTLAAWRMTGTGPAYIKLGRRVVYDPKAIFSWLERNTRQSTSQKMEVRNV